MRCVHRDFPSCHEGVGAARARREGHHPFWRAGERLCEEGAEDGPGGAGSRGPDPRHLLWPPADGKLLGGTVARSDHREYGKGTIRFRGRRSDCWWASGRIPRSGTATGIGSRSCPKDSGPSRFQRIHHLPRSRTSGGAIFGLQFHPEVSHTPDGTKILSNFVARHMRLPSELDDARPSSSTRARPCARRSGLAR